MQISDVYKDHAQQTNYEEEKKTTDYSLTTLCYHVAKNKGLSADGKTNALFDGMKRTVL